MIFAKVTRFPFVLIFLGTFAVPLFATIQIQLTPSLTSPRPVGTTITWSATATDSNAGSLSYRFSVGPAAGPILIVRDYESSNTFQWTPAQYDGVFQVQVTVMNTTTQGTRQVTVNYQITSRVSGNQPVVSPTAHPLVALYSAPPCPVGSSISVRLWLSGSTYNQFTPFVPCQAGTSMNFYIAGMTANTTYQLDDSVMTGSQVTVSSKLNFTTGAIPASITVPDFDVQTPATANSSLTQGILLHSVMLDRPLAIATDFAGKVLWYNPAPLELLERPVAGGTMLVVASVGPSASDGRGQILREIDLAGNILRETTSSRISDQLLAMGEPQPIDGMNHEAVRLPNGYTAVISSVERIYPAGTQGSTAPVDILGNMVIVLDQNWQVVWFWNAFDHLSINRAAVLGEVCTSTDVGCPILMLSNTANDWLHANSITYSPSDGNLVVSLRHQDWVVKIDYSNGTGTGNVLWHLGNQGDFTLSASPLIAYPWFSHQHDATYESGGSTFLSLYDNGNTRVAENPGLTENSRGQMLQLNESNLTATLVVNVDLGVFSQAFGSVQLLLNGDYSFTSGWINPGLDPYTIDVETTPAGTVEFQLRSRPAATYRSFRMSTFYAP